MSTYSNQLQPALQNLVLFGSSTRDRHARTHISTDVFVDENHPEPATWQKAYQHTSQHILTSTCDCVYVLSDFQCLQHFGLVKERLSPPKPPCCSEVRPAQPGCSEILATKTSCAGGCHNMPPPPESWPLTFDLETESSVRVTCDVASVPILVFLDLSVLDLGLMYATDRRYTSDAHHSLMPPTLGANKCCYWESSVN